LSPVSIFNSLSEANVFSIKLISFLIFSCNISFHTLAITSVVIGDIVLRFEDSGVIVEELESLHASSALSFKLSKDGEVKTPFPLSIEELPATG
jgi:hypothetical protein